MPHRSWDRYGAPKPVNAYELLMELDTRRQRGDGRLDTPDLYKSGLGLKRKGGVRPEAEKMLEGLAS